MLVGRGAPPILANPSTDSTPLLSEFYEAWVF
jgi:hypothetical protein